MYDLTVSSSMSRVLNPIYNSRQLLLYCIGSAPGAVRDVLLAATGLFSQTRFIPARVL